MKYIQCQIVLELQQSSLTNLQGKKGTCVHVVSLLVLFYNVKILSSISGLMMILDLSSVVYVISPAAQPTT